MDSEDRGEVIRDEVNKLREAFKDIKDDKGKDVTVEDLKASIDGLNKSIQTLLEVFEKAGKLLDNEAESTNQIDQLLDQNKQIANALITHSSTMNNNYTVLSKKLADLSKEIQARPRAVIQPKVQSFQPELSVVDGNLSEGTELFNTDQPPNVPPPPEKKHFFGKK